MANVLFIEYYCIVYSLQKGISPFWKCVQVMKFSYFSLNDSRKRIEYEMEKWWIVFEWYQNNFFAWYIPRWLFAIDEQAMYTMPFISLLPIKVWTESKNWSFLHLSEIWLKRKKKRHNYILFREKKRILYFSTKISQNFFSFLNENAIPMIVIAHNWYFWSRHSENVASICIVFIYC